MYALTQLSTLTHLPQLVEEEVEGQWGAWGNKCPPLGIQTIGDVERNCQAISTSQSSAGSVYWLLNFLRGLCCCCF